MTHSLENNGHYAHYKQCFMRLWCSLENKNINVFPETIKSSLISLKTHIYMGGGGGGKK